MRRYLVMIVFACLCLGVTLVAVHEVTKPDAPCRKSTILADCR